MQDATRVVRARLCDVTPRTTKSHTSSGRVFGGGNRDGYFWVLRGTATDAKWALQDSNLRPTDYESAALTD